MFTFRRVVLLACWLGGALWMATAAQAQWQRPERSLAGITVGSKGLIVLRKYGNPSRAVNGITGAVDASVAAATANASPTGPAGPYPPATEGAPGVNPYASYRNPYPGGGVSPMGYSPGAPVAAIPGVGAIPGVPSGPGALPAPGDTELGQEGVVGGVGTSPGADLSAPKELLVTWVYNMPKQHCMVEFRLDEDGRVVEIAGTGYKPTPLVRTSKGVTLGDPYGKVLRLYGPPDTQFQQGNITTISYQDKYHVAFQLRNLKVVRIVVAEVRS